MSGEQKLMIWIAGFTIAILTITVVVQKIKLSEPRPADVALDAEVEAQRERRRQTMQDQGEFADRLCFTKGGVMMIGHPTIGPFEDGTVIMCNDGTVEQFQGLPWVKGEH